MHIILHVITNFQSAAGAELNLVKVINASPLNTQHTIVSLMSISDVLKKKLTRTVRFHSLNSKNAIGLLFSVLKIRRIIKSSQSNIIYSWMYHANVIAALSTLFFIKKPLLIWGVRHSLDDLKGEGISTKLAIFAGKLLRCIPSKVIYCSERSMHQHENLGYSPENKNIYIPNGYDFENYQPRDFKTTPFVLGAAGRFHEAKDYKTLFKAVAPILNKYKNIRLKIAGRDMDNFNAVIKQYMTAFNIHFSQVELLGAVHDMTDFYGSIDFFILSSKTEGFPNVLAEAAGNGCLTFSTDVGDASLIVNDNHRLVKVGDAASLTGKLNSYLNKSSQELSQLANDSALYIRTNFAIDSIAKKLFSIGEKSPCAE